MKKIFILIITIIFLFPQTVFSQSSENNENETPENKIDQIKEKVTNRVAELDLVEKRGIVGTVEEVNGTQIKINDLNDKIRIIEIDEITKYSSPEKYGFNANDIEKGTRLSIIGLYNKDSEKLLARFISEISIPEFLVGVISEKNEDDFTATLITEDENKYLIDIETITRTFSFLDGELDSSGFSDLESLQNVIVIGFLDPKEKGRISATKIITFPDTPNNPNIKIETPEPTKEDISPTPSSEEEWKK